MNACAMVSACLRYQQGVDGYNLGLHNTVEDMPWASDVLPAEPAGSPDFTPLVGDTSGELVPDRTC